MVQPLPDLDNLVQPVEDMPAPSPRPPSPPPLPPPPTGRGHRKKRPTWKVLEQQARSLPPPQPLSSSSAHNHDVPPPPPFEPHFASHQTSPNQFGLYSTYKAPIMTLPPGVNPTTFTAPTPLLFTEPARNVPSRLAVRALSAVDELAEKLKACSNYSSAKVMEWYWNTSNKSLDDCDRLVHNVLLDPNFKPTELMTFSARRETALMDKALSRDNDRWIESSIAIEVPDGQPHTSTSDPPIPIFTIPGLMHRPLTEIIRTVWSSSSSVDFQYIPFRQFWVNPTSYRHERVYGELYSSDAFIDEHDALQRQPPEEGCSLERVICAVMAFSDSTHLTSFGDASLWPLYIYFGNQSKYSRVQPSSGCCHHAAYIPKVCDPLICSE